MTGSTESGFALPSYRKPPVIEVAMCIGFTPIVGLQFEALAELRARWSKEYPKTEEYPFLETPEGPNAIRIEFGPPPRRLWFLTPLGDRVIQIQRDRLVANWRAIPDQGLPYPRYDQLRAEFTSKWSDFQQFVAEQKIAPAVESQYAEVTYVNAIAAETDEASYEISDVLRVPPEDDSWRAKGVRSTAVTRTWDVADFDTTLSTAANIDISAANCPVMFQIVAKTKISKRRAPMQALDLAHEFVVGSFGVVTTEKMQVKWERE
jgi:uncharacterized protein (TIGR04255 family)